MLYSVTGPDVNTDEFTDERASVIKDLRGYNMALTLSSFNELVDSFVPINLNLGSQMARLQDTISGYDSESLFHSSSVPSLAINDFFMPLTQKKPMQDMENALYPLNLFRR